MDLLRTLIQNNITIGVIGSLVASIIWYLIPRLNRKYKIKKINSVFSIENRNAGVILGGWTGIKPEWTVDLFVHAEAISSLTKLSKLFTKYGIDLDYSIDKEGEETKAYDLEICIGGINANIRTSYYLNRYLKKIFISDRRTVNQNEALIIKLSIIVNEGGQFKTVLIIYGAGAFETKSAIYYFYRHFDDLISRSLKPYNSVIRLETSRKLGVNNARFKKDESKLYIEDKLL